MLALHIGDIKDPSIPQMVATDRLLNEGSSFKYAYNSPRDAGPGVDGLPELTGSAKQVAWAQDIRAYFEDGHPEHEAHARETFQ